jgi:hypothetical protein
VRVSDEERVRFEKLAQSRHTTLSQLIRHLLHVEADKAEKGKAA